MKKQISEKKLSKYISLTEKALEAAKNNINQKNKKQAKEIIQMVSCYLSDSKHFKEKKDFVNSFAAINYAHGWLDTGARLGIFEVKDNKLFTIE